MENFDINKIQLAVQTPGVKISDSLHNGIIARIEKLGKLHPRIKKCEVLLQRENSNKTNKCNGEVRFYIPGKMLFAKEKGLSYKAVLDGIFEDLEDQLKRMMNKRAKEKKKNLRHSLPG